MGMMALARYGEGFSMVATTVLALNKERRHLLLSTASDARRALRAPSEKVAMEKGLRTPGVTPGMRNKPPPHRGMESAMSSCGTRTAVDFNVGRRDGHHPEPRAECLMNDPQTERHFTVAGGQARSATGGCASPIKLIPKSSHSNSRPILRPAGGSRSRGYIEEQARGRA